VGSDRVTNAETKRRTNTRDIVRVSHVLKWIWGAMWQEWVRSG